MVRFFIERPIFSSAVAIVMVLAGLIAYELLPVAEFPEITPPQVVVSATYAGASAQIVLNMVSMLGMVLAIGLVDRRRHRRLCRPTKWSNENVSTPYGTDQETPP